MKDLLSISDGQRIPTRAKLTHSQTIFLKIAIHHYYIPAFMPPLTKGLKTLGKEGRVVVKATGF